MYEIYESEQLQSQPLLNFKVKKLTLTPYLILESRQKKQIVLGKTQKIPKACQSMSASDMNVAHLTYRVYAMMQMVYKVLS